VRPSQTAHHGLSTHHVRCARRVPASRRSLRRTLMGAAHRDRTHGSVQRLDATISLCGPGAAACCPSQLRKVNRVQIQPGLNGGTVCLRGQLLDHKGRSPTRDDPGSPPIHHIVARAAAARSTIGHARRALFQSPSTCEAVRSKRTTTESLAVRGAFTWGSVRGRRCRDRRGGVQVVAKAKLK
jgi:hypothetical protein